MPKWILTTHGDVSATPAVGAVSAGDEDDDRDDGDERDHDGERDTCRRHLRACAIVGRAGHART
jgi:hypothetical protein